MQSLPMNAKIDFIICSNFDIFDNRVSRRLYINSVWYIEFKPLAHTPNTETPKKKFVNA